MLVMEVPRTRKIEKCSHIYVCISRLSRIKFNIIISEDISNYWLNISNYTSHPFHKEVLLPFAFSRILLNIFVSE